MDSYPMVSRFLISLHILPQVCEYADIIAFFSNAFKLPPVLTSAMYAYWKNSKVYQPCRIRHFVICLYSRTFVTNDLSTFMHFYQIKFARNIRIYVEYTDFQYSD